METKKLNEYDMKRIISRAKKEFGIIVRGTEDNYNPQLDNLEHVIYFTYYKNPITDLELKMVIEIIIYDLKSIIDNINYDYKDIRDKKLIKFSKEIQKYFNPKINRSIKLTDEANNNLKEVLSFPIKCLLRIYDSIDFWHNRYGSNGYFRMLEEYVLPIISIGKYPFILEYKNISNENHNKIIDDIVDNLYEEVDFSHPEPTKEVMSDMIKVINYLLDFSKKNNINNSEELEKYDVIDKKTEYFIEDFNMCICNLKNNIYNELDIINVLDDIMNTLKLTDNTYENVLRSKVLLLFRLKKYEEAENIMKKYIDEHPKNVYAYIELIDNFIRINNLDKAKYYYECAAIYKDMEDYDALEQRYEDVYK